MLARNSVPDRALAAFILGFWAIWQTASFWDVWATDMSAIYFAAYFAYAGEPAQIFASPEYFFGLDFPQRWIEQRNALGYFEEALVPYVYPPIWAYVLGPIAGNSDPLDFFNYARLFLYGSFSATIYLIWAIVREKTKWSATVFATVSMIIASQTIPYQFAAGLAQPQLIVFFLIALAFWLFVNGMDIGAGVALGLAAALKITPIFLVLIFVMDRRHRATIVTFATSGAIALSSVLVAGWPLHEILLEQMSLIDAGVPLIGLNTNFELFMHRTFVPEHFRVELGNDGFVTANVAAITWASHAGLLLSVLATIRATTKLDLVDRTFVRLMGIYSFTFFFGPLAWIHYYVLTFLMLPLFVHLVGVRLVFVVMTALVGATSYYTTVTLLYMAEGFAFFQTMFAPILFACVAATIYAAGAMRKSPEKAELKQANPVPV